MSKQLLTKLLNSALQTLQSSGQLQADIPNNIQIDTTKDKSHGDFASNIALMLAKPAKKNPRELAELIIQHLPHSDLVKKIEVAGPGFINFFLTPSALYQVVFDILQQGDHYGRHQVGQNKKALVEFVSSNPTGPLHVGHGRHAAYGAVVSDLLSAVGYQVHREYYVNDAGRQMNILAVSVLLRYLTVCGATLTFPANAYQGKYVIDIANAFFADHGKTFQLDVEKIFNGLPPDEPQGGDKELYIDALIDRVKALMPTEKYNVLFEFALEKILQDIREDLADFGVQFQSWFSERAFVQSDAVDRNIQALKDKGLVYEREDALWFRATDFGDEKDRVLVRSNGQRTYFANDFAYHVNKFERGFDLAIDIFGSDHHGYVPRMKAGLKARDLSSDKLIYLLLQFVTLCRSGKPVPMSTRSGSFVTLRELREEVGHDAARFFYVMRKFEQPIEFDLDLAKAESSENPVYYVQYAHARICSVFKQLIDKGWRFEKSDQLDSLKEEYELTLLSLLARYPEIILHAALQYEPSLLTSYLRELASQLHGYYNSHQFLVDDEVLRNARLTLILATQQVFKNGLTLLGVSAPESM